MFKWLERVLTKVDTVVLTALSWVKRTVQAIVSWVVECEPGWAKAIMARWVTIVLVAMLFSLFLSAGMSRPDEPVTIKPQVYTVVKGDCLWKIAQSQMGNKHLWPLIQARNSIQNPDLIYPGQALIIPQNPSKEDTEGVRAYSTWRRAQWRLGLYL